MSKSESDGCTVLIVGILIFAAISSAISGIIAAILGFLGMFWPLIVGGIVAIAVGWFGLSYMLSVKKRKRDQAKAEKDSAADNERKRKLAVAAKTYLSEFSEYLTPCLIIDSNIWMNEDYNGFFVLLAASCNAKNYKLSLYGTQFDEISNIKKMSQFGEERNKRARVAINRIEVFQKQQWMKIESVTIDAQQGAYADPTLVKLITAKARQGKECTFISDDKELRIRVRQHLSDLSEANWKIVEVASILAKCRAFEEAYRLGLLQNKEG